MRVTALRTRPTGNPAVAEATRPTSVKRAAARPLQRRAIQKLHGNESLAAFFADVIDGTNVGMIQSRGGLRFALKARQHLGISGHLVGQEFQGHKAVQSRVLCLVHHSHAAAAQPFQNAVVRDGLPDE